MKIKQKSICFLLSLIFLSSIVTGCRNPGGSKFDDNSRVSSFRDVPGLSKEDIMAVEELLSHRESFSYGMMLSTEAFIEGETGEIRGYSALMCEWLTELFGVPFIPRHFTWNEILDGLENHSIDFTGTVTPTPERLLTYLMTEPIAQRSIKYFHLSDSNFSSREIAAERKPRYALLRGAASADNILKYAIYEFEPVFVSEYIEAYELLLAGEIDALLAESSAEAIFDVYGNIVTTPFMPLIYSPVSLTTKSVELEPIIRVIKKVLENDGKQFLDKLYDEGHFEYLKHKLFLQLTDEEKEYIKNNPEVPFGAECSNYPISFYNARYGEWQGIAFDVLKEITLLTGLEFPVVNDEQTNFYRLLEMLKDGRIHMLSEVIRSPEREGNFIWPENALMVDRSVIISKVSYPSINMNRIYSAKVGLTKSSAHTEFFFSWFPNHQNYNIYDSQQSTFDALVNEEVDLVINSYSTLLNLINYQELPDYKANILFDNSFVSTFGINANQPVLRSIIDKSLALIETEDISENWRNRTYDYRLRVIQAQRPWIFGAVILLLCVLILVVVFFVRSRNIGKRLEKLVEERTHKLALETATLNTVFNSIPDLIFTKDVDSRFINCNDSLLKNFGLKKEDIIGKDDIEGLGMPADIAENFVKEDKIAMQEGRAVITEKNLPCVDGTNPLFEILKMPLMVDGNIVGVVGISRDITERKGVYDYIKKLNDALSKITQSPTISAGNLKAAADIITKEGSMALKTYRVSVWSVTDELSALKNISCYNCVEDEYVMQRDFDLNNHREYANMLKTERVIVLNGTERMAVVNETKKSADGYGSDLCALLDAPIRVDGKLVGLVSAEQNRCDEYPGSRDWMMEEQSFVSSLADLAALAISGYERRKARDEAEIANKSKSAFLANMSHEIRTPMNAILGITEMLIQNESLPDSVENGLSKIFNSCGMLLGIINDILDFSKIEAGKLDITPASYLVASLINDAVQLNVMRIESKPIEFKLIIDENLPSKLIGDELRIKQILNNLLSNAFKYTESGTVTMSVGFKPDLDGKRVTLEFSIKDSGRGMTAEQVEKLFDEYSRFNSDSKKRVEGTGLGLAITQRLIGLMNGEIHVNSVFGFGSLFTVNIPQEVADSDALGRDVVDNLRLFRINNLTHSKIYQINRELMPYGTVLVVDDVETNLYVAAGLMKPYELQIETVLSGYEAVNKIKSGKTYDIVFMDHMMPMMDGIETTKQLREAGYDKPIVALSANAVAGQAEIFLKNGFDDFISKPIDVRQLNLILNKYVRDKQPPEVIEAAHSRKSSTEQGGTPLQVDRTLLESFVKDARKAVAVIEELQQKNELATDEADLRRLTIYVHGIKSSLWNINEKELSKVAAKLESESRAKNIDLIVSSLPAFLNELRTISDKAESALTNSTVEADGGEPEELREKLLAVKEMCADYNRKGALDIIADMNIHKNPVLNKIKELVLDGRFEETEDAVQAYIGGKPTLKSRKIEGLDIKRGIEKYNDDEEIYISIMRSYVASTRSMLEVMKDTSEENIKDYEIKVHGIKGASRDMFAEEIGDAAAALERAAKEKDFEYINDNNSSFLDSAYEFISKLENLLAEIDAENPKPKKEKPDKELLLKLLEACKMYNMDGADEAMAELRKYEYEEDNNLVIWLGDKFDMTKFDEIAEKLTKEEI